MRIMWTYEKNIMRIMLILQIFFAHFRRDRRTKQLTDQELHKLNRKELLELLLDQSRQIDSLREQLQQAQGKKWQVIDQHSALKNLLNTISTETTN